MNEDKEKKTRVEITVDNKGTEELVKILKEKEQKEVKDDLAERKIQAYQKFHIEGFLDATSKEDLNMMLTSHINALMERDKPTPAGFAPLNSEQMGQRKENLYEKKFGTYYEMVMHLTDISHGNSPQAEEAKSYLNSLMKKYVLDKRNNPERVEGFHNPNSPEALAQLDLVQKGEVLTPRNPEDGDIGKILHAWKLERLARMKKGSEQQ